MRLAIALSLFIFSTGLLAITTRATDCEPSDETRQALKRFEIEDQSGKSLGEKHKMILQDLLAQHPDDVFLHLRYQEIAGEESIPERNAVVERYKVLADAHPHSAEYLFLYANALVDANTPQAIAELQKIVSTEPSYPLAHLELAEIYNWGRFANHPETRAQLSIFYDLCPASLNDQALSLLAHTATPEMAAKYSAPLRERMLKETEPDRLNAWETVWNLEFKAHSPAEHPQVRKQLAADLARLQQSPQSSVEWLSLLEAGYKMLGDEEKLRRIQDQIMAEYPETDEAKMAYRERWTEEHPAPKPEDSEAAKQAFYRAEFQKASERLKKFPNDPAYIVERFDALSQLDDSTPRQIVAAGEAMRKALRNVPDWRAMPPFQFQIAKAFLKKKTHVDEVPDLVADGCREVSGIPSTTDREGDEERGLRTQNDLFMRIEAASILLDAAEQLKKPEIAAASVKALEDAKPDKRFAESIWTVKAKWAELNGHKLDALLMYRAALDARPADSKPKGRDELAENFDRLWKELGGTAEGKGLWTRAEKPVEAVSEGRWEKSIKALPPWQLPDLEGRTWKAESLRGKTVLINVWATWCEPCRSEHPYLQKLYEKIQGRSDIQIVTFNIDSEIGDVAPYIAKNKYTFPVLLARDYVDDFLPQVSIPRNWVVDETGKLQWEQIGFGPDETWADTTLAKLEQPK